MFVTQFGSGLEEHGIWHLSTDFKNLKFKRDFGPFFFCFSMKKIILLLFFIPLVSFADWGKTGHRVIGEIAAMNLTPEATAAVKDLLEGRSIARIGTWADEIRSNPDYNQYTSWHYVNLPLEQRYEEVEHKGDNVVKAINLCIEGLKKLFLNKRRKSLLFKILNPLFS